MTKFASILALALVAVSLLGLSSIGTVVAQDDGDDKKKPNILFIPVDDLNNWVGYFAKHTRKGNAQSMTPNIDRLSAMGVSFTNAHASSTICNPSRAAVWSGVRSGVSGCYDNKDHPWTAFIKEGLGLNAHFKNNGYYAAARGKTYHSSQQGFEEPRTCYIDEWDEYPKIGFGDAIKEVTERAGFTEPLTVDLKDDDDPDWHTVDYCIDWMNKDPKKRDYKPFFLACGLVKPHLPWAVPSAYYDLYPADTVELPPYSTTNDWKEWDEAIWDDLSDVPEYAINKFANPDKEYTEVIELGRWESSIQSYLATINYMDMNVGRLLDAYEESPEKDNTIIVLWSDHGYHLGEKGHHKKQTLWEEASDVPFIWVVPGVTTPGTICDRPVDLQSIYPTLSDLAGLDVPDHVDGDNIRPLLEDPNAEWDGVAKITMRYKNHAVVDQRYRYIRYVDGSEELYDHDVDPDEFNNLAGDREYDDIKERLAKHMPKADMPPWHDGSLKWLMDTMDNCNDEEVTVTRCPDGSFVARDPNNFCRFVECPEYVPEPTASPTLSPTANPTESPTTATPTGSPTPAPVTSEPSPYPTRAPDGVTDAPVLVSVSTTADSDTDPETSISELLDFTINIDIPPLPPAEGSGRLLQEVQRSAVVYYLNDNLEAIISESLRKELLRETKSSGFPYAKPTGVSLLRKNKKVFQLDNGGERYRAVFGGIVKFGKIEEDHFLPTESAVQSMQTQALSRVGDEVIDVVKADIGTRVTSVVTDVLDDPQGQGNVAKSEDNISSNTTLIIIICCSAGGTIILALGVIFFVRSHRAKKGKKPDGESADDYFYPEDTSENELKLQGTEETSDEQQEQEKAKDRATPHLLSD